MSTPGVEHIQGPLMYVVAKNARPREFAKRQCPQRRQVWFNAKTTQLLVITGASMFNGRHHAKVVLWGGTECLIPAEEFGADHMVLFRQEPISSRSCFAGD